MDFDVIVEAPAEDTADANIGAAAASITDYERERILYSSLRRASNKTPHNVTNLYQSCITNLKTYHNISFCTVMEQ